MKLQRRTPDAPIPYVPMADLAFNLVLFFVILAKGQQEDLAWERAKSPGTREIAPAGAIVGVDRDGKVFLNARQVSTRDPAALAQEINGLLGDGPPDKRVVMLKVHRKTPSATFLPILEAVSLAGGEVVHVLDEER